MPPPIDRLLGDAGPGCDALDGDPGVADLGDEVVHRLKHGLAGRLAAAVPVAVMQGRSFSYGISTLHLAAAVRDNGIGHVITTELSKTKVRAARATIEAAGLSDLVTVLEGDALATLGTVSDPIGLALLDGWKEMCLPVLRLLEDRLPPGALVIGDDSTFESMSDYLTYVRDPGHGYVSVGFPVEDGMELSCWTGR